MDIKITTLDGKEAGSVSCPTRFSASSRASTSCSAASTGSSPSASAARTRSRPRGEIWRTGKKMYAQKGTGGARHGSARVPQFRGGGRAFGPVVRSHAHGLPKKVRALALRHALSAKAKDGGIIVIDKASVKDAKTKALAAQFGKLSLANALIIDGAEVEANFRSAARNIPNIDVLPSAGHQRLRHHAPQDAGADQGRARCAGGAVQMSTSDPRHYDVILSPVITEKATMASEHNKVVFKVARNATKPQIKEAVEKLFDVKVKNVNTLIRQGKVKMFKGRLGQQSDVKRAIVTLEEGHRST